jgi:multiple sugar transport system permease protein
VKSPLLWFEPTFEHWQAVITGGDFLKFYKNSLLIAAVTDVVVLTAGSAAGYALARFRVRRKEDLAFWILSQSMMPPVAVILPLYVLYSSARLLSGSPEQV